MKTTIDTLEDFKTALNDNPTLQQEFRENPLKAAENHLRKTPKETDSWIYRIIVISLRLAIFSIIITLTIMTMNVIKDDFNPQIITIFTAISSGAIGALARLLAPSPNNVNK